MAEEPKAHDETPPGIDDHPFEPRGEWWSLCKHCRLARAAHSSSVIDVQAEMIKDHIERHGAVQHAKRKEELRRLTTGGRVQIAYYSDDNPDDE